MDISIDTFVDEDLKKIDEMPYVVNIIPIDFRGQRALLPQWVQAEYLLIILQK